MMPQLRKRSDGAWSGIRVEGFRTVHALEVVEPETIWRPLCHISSGSDALEPTNDEVTCGRCIRMLAKPKLTPRQKAYSQGWRHGTKDELKKGPANQKDERLRAAYLQGFEHGSSDLENAEQHGKQHYGTG